MSQDRAYPTTDAGPFPRPPTTRTDREARQIDIRTLEEATEALIAMYRDFDPSQRAQGIPPSDPDRVPPWVRSIVTEGVHVVGTHEDRVIGHAMLVPDEAEAHELAIFVHQDYQGSGNGRALITHLLGAGIDAGVDRVWLTVERWNRPAIELYREVGFETVQADRFDLEMSLSLEKSTAAASATE